MVVKVVETLISFSCSYLLDLLLLPPQHLDEDLDPLVYLQNYVHLIELISFHLVLIDYKQKHRIQIDE